MILPGSTVKVIDENSIYRGFFANQNLTDPWDDHDD